MKWLSLLLTCALIYFGAGANDEAPYRGNLAISCIGDQLIPMGYAFIIYKPTGTPATSNFFEEPKDSDYIDFTNQNGRVYVSTNKFDSFKDHYVYIKSPCFPNREIENECVPFHRVKFSNIKNFFNKDKPFQLLRDAEHHDGGCI
uniref:Uncharacterized protein n=1 Tax=Panagrolaimus sp. JU765 TaxID=591449 RepID=A0AC34QSU0_9BILA